MKVIENKKLSKLLEKSIGVDVETGMIFIINEDETTIDITNDILELTVLAVEDSTTFIGLNRHIEITVSDITNEYK